MIRVVLDPGVLVSALISPTGSPAMLIRAWIDGAFDLVVCETLLDELDAVLRRSKFRKYFREEEGSAFVEWLRESALIVPDPIEVRRVTPDPADDYLVALSIEAGAQVLVSGDSDLTGLPGAQPRVLTPHAFLDMLV